MTDVIAGRDDWVRYLVAIEQLAASADVAATGGLGFDNPGPVRPTTALPLELASRARVAMAALADAEEELERRLGAVRDELRSSARGRRRMQAPPAPASTLDVVA